MTDCLFCKIANKEAPADIIYEDDKILGFDNIKHEAPIHYLFIPKRHIEWKGQLSQEDLSVFGDLVSSAKKVAQKEEIFEACKLIFNVGKTGHIAHIHLHLLGGWESEVPMHNI